MFEIYGGYEKLTQWSKNQKLIMDRLPVGAEILFYNDPSVDDPLITEVYEIVDDKGNTVNVCDVPNILLTESKRLKVMIPSVVVGRYGVVHKYVGQRERYFEVEAADQPSDYVYEETPVEGCGCKSDSVSDSISEDQITAVIDKYVEDNGIAAVPEGGVAVYAEIVD